MWIIWHPFPAESLKKAYKNESANKYTLLDSNIENKKQTTSMLKIYYILAISHS